MSQDIPDLTRIPDVVYLESMIATTAALREINREIRESMAELDREIEETLQEMETDA